MLTEANEGVFSNGGYMNKRIVLFKAHVSFRVSNHNFKDKKTR